MDKLEAITLWQPWATLVAIGAKRFEFRGWPPPRRLVGRRIAIHAGARKSPKSELRELLVKLQGQRWRETGIASPELAVPLLEQALSNPTVFPLGAVICTAGLGRPMRGVELSAALGTDPVPGADTNWGWPLMNIQVLEPAVPARGDKGFWEWVLPNDRRAA